MKQNYKSILTLAVVFAVAAGALYFFTHSTSQVAKQESSETAQPSDYKNTTYIIEGESITLVDGMSEIEVADTGTYITTRYFGNEIVKDVDEDGREDVVFLLTQETGGTGVFFYVVAALNTERGYVGSRALLLGDRIAPQTTESGPGRSVIVNYVDRKAGESYTTPPSVGKSLTLLFDIRSMQFGEVVQDFEGEAEPARMTLEMKQWYWQGARYTDGREITPRQKDAFSITFDGKGGFSVSTDCNAMSGAYTVTGNTISFSDIATTLMYCEGSQETEFASLLQDTTKFHFTSRGELILSLKLDSGSVVFR